MLGDEQALSEGLRERFRASGLYHLLAVSGQNVVARRRRGARPSPGWSGCSRWLGQIGALAAIAAYVLAVGAQPSVIRAGVVGRARLARLACRAARRSLVLLPAGRARPPRLESVHAARPGLPALVRGGGGDLRARSAAAEASRATRCRRQLAGVVAVSTACGLATAPILWLQFHALPLLTVPANAVAAPAVAPLLGARLRGGARRAGFTAGGRRDRLAQRLVRGVPRRLRAHRRRPAGRTGPSGRSLLELLLRGGRGRAPMLGGGG